MRLAVFLKLAVGMAFLPAAAEPPAQHFAAQGIGLDLAVTAAGGKLAAGGDVALDLNFSDQTTGSPLRGASPAAWLSQRRPGEAADDARCARKIGAFVAGSPVERPDADLTGFAVLTLNRDSSLTVIDPQSGYGGSRVLALIKLDAPGGDWTFGQDPKRVYIAEPGADKIVAIDLDHWRREAAASVTAPGALLFQPGKGLWASDATGVILLDAQSLEVRAQIATGGGPHRLAGTANGAFIFVANSADRTVSVIDAVRNTKLRDVTLDAPPSAVAVSALSGFAYVASAKGIAILDPARPALVGEIAAGEGIAAIAISPDGRWGFAPMPGDDQVLIFDIVTGRAVQTLPVAGAPGEIGFTATEAYIRHRGSETVTLVPLATLSEAGKPAGLAEFPAGERAFPADAAIVAASMASAPGEGAMLLASPSERLVHYYHEGMAAPAGSFDNAGRQPVAVAVLDRSLRETAPGRYRASLRLPAAGLYDVAVLLDTPRLVHCFTVEIGPADGAQPRQALRMVPVGLPDKVAIGETVTLRFRAVNPATRQLAPPPRAVTVQATLAPGTWNRRFALVRGPDESWGFDFTAPEPGVYMLAFEAPAEGLTFASGGTYSFEVVPAKAEGHHG